MIYLFGRFHARAGSESAVEAAIREVIPPSSAEPGCLAIHGFRSTRDPRLFHIHSQWKDQAAFDLHTTLPHTVRFLEAVDPLLDQPREVTLSEMLA